MDLAVLATSVLAGWYAVQEMRVPLAPVLILLSPVALWSLTGEPAADVGWVGSIAAGLRSKFGLRRAHEWLLAWAHYFRLAIWPIWKARCVAFWNSSRRRITDWKARLSDTTKCSNSHGYLWGYKIRFNWWAKPGK